MPRGGCDSWSVPAVPVPLWGLCCSALTRRRAGSFRRIVNCAPAKCCVWPVTAPAEASVRAGERLGQFGMRDAQFGILGTSLSGNAVLSRYFAFGSRVPNVPVGMSGVQFTPAVRFCWDVWRSVHACRAVLLECLAFGSRLPCGSAGMSGVRFTPAVRFCWDVLRLVHACHTFLLGCLASVHACLFSFVRKRETACGILRSYSAGSGSPLERSRIAVRLSGFVGSLRVCPFLYGDPDGVTGDAGDERRGYEGTGLAARPLCAFAQAHWPCRSFRREYAGAARPRLRQRVFDSLDSLHAAAGLPWCVIAAPSPGHTEIPARFQ